MSAVNLQVVRKRSIQSQIPIEADDFQKRLIETCGVCSMTGPIRMWSLIQPLDYIKDQNIPGDLVQCGVWKGENLALISKYRDKLELIKRIFGYDTFDGMSEAEDVDVDVDHEGNAAKLQMNYEQRDEAEKNIHAFASLS